MHTPLLYKYMYIVYVSWDFLKVSSLFSIFSPISLELTAVHEGVFMENLQMF